MNARMDAVDPVAYVRATPPFDALPGALFEAAARALEIGFYPAGTWLVRAGRAPLEHLYVIRRGTVRLERAGQTVEVLEEGETFGYTSLITRQATLDVVVEDDLLAYLLPDAEFQRLRADAAFAGHFAVGLAERLEKALEHAPVVAFQPDVSGEVAKLVRRPPVWLEAGATAAEAARLMREERISSVLVRGDPPGIVTDRDLTNRVLADGLGPETPLGRILTAPLRTLSAEAPTYEAWAAILDAGVHHLPVVRGGGIVGVLTATDLLKSSAHGPVAVLRRVERLSGRASLPGYAAKVAEMAAALLGGGLDAPAIGGLVARINDALVARLVAWAEADLGAPPAPYAWLAFGSEGRAEQALLTDQDNGLVHGDEPAGRDEYWRAFAERLNADLESAGFPPCPHGHMARTERGPLREWRRRFDSCVDERRPLAATLLFDFRKVAGGLSVEPLEAAMARAARNGPFLRYLARAAIEHRPPASLRLRGDDQIDLKAQGTLPIVHLARCYGVEVGTGARGTLDRLKAARAAGLLSAETHDGVAHAYRFLLGLSLRHQLRRISEGAAPSTAVPIAELGALERSRLKDAFRVVKVWQENAAFHFRTDFF
jgi:CBS domain-containing protein